MLDSLNLISPIHKFSQLQLKSSIWYITWMSHYDVLTLFPHMYCWYKYSITICIIMLRMFLKLLLIMLMLIIFINVCFLSFKCSYCEWNNKSLWNCPTYSASKSNTIFAEPIYFNGQSGPSLYSLHYCMLTSFNADHFIICLFSFF